MAKYMIKRLFSLLLVLSLLLSSCETADSTDSSEPAGTEESYYIFDYSFDDDWTVEPYYVTENLKTTPPCSEIAEIPYDGNDYIELNGNKPFFKTDKLLPNVFMVLSPLDRLNRAGMAICCVGEKTLSDDERKNSSLPNPTGWHSVEYDNISNKYLYHRCHILSYQLTGENSRIENLITGTCYLNTHSMLKFENAIANCIKAKGLHVLYRVTPVYKGDELLARGVLLEAFSIEDNGEEICFCVYVYNVQPGIDIDYLTGESTPIH